MNGPAALLALALLQEPQAAPPAPAAEKVVEPEPAVPPAQQPRAVPRPAPPAETTGGPAAHEAPAAPRLAPRATRTWAPASPATSTPTATPTRPATSTPAPTSASTTTPAATGASHLPAHPVPPERAEVAAAAARFFRTLLARRADDLAALSSPGFSFDGRAARGADEVRRRWSEAVARHDGVPYALYDLEVLPAADASARFGKPPRRIAALVQPGAWVAAANLSGRPTFVFFARQGGAWLATGIHD